MLISRVPDVSKHTLARDIPNIFRPRCILLHRGLKIFGEIAAFSVSFALVFVLYY